MALYLGNQKISGMTLGNSKNLSDHAQLSNLDFIHSGHTGFMSNENFIPNDTIINVKTDGTGDFANLYDAVNYLTGKWSNNQVTIQLGNGTFVIDSKITLDCSLNTIKQIVITGNGVSNTILQNSLAANTNLLEILNKGYVRVKDLSIIRPDGTSSTRYRGITYNLFAEGIVENINFQGIDVCVRAMRNSNIMLNGTLNFTDCYDCVLSNGSNLTTSSGAAMDFTRIGAKCFYAYNGGQIHGYGLSCTYSNVEEKTNIEVGTATNDGWITGIST